MITGYYFIGWDIMPPCRNPRRHTSNIDLRVSCQNIITPNEKASIFCSLEEFEVSVSRQDGLKAKPLALLQTLFTPILCDLAASILSQIQDSLNFICIDIRKHRRAQQICYCTLTGTVWSSKTNYLRLFI